MRHSKNQFLKVFLGTALLGTMAAIPVSAEEYSILKGPEGLISETMISTPDNQAVFAINDYNPELKEGNYEKWIDRVELPDYALTFYETLKEGADYDGYEDFLIDDQASIIDRIRIYEFDKAGEQKQVNAKGVKLVTLTAYGCNENEAYEKANQYYYEAFYNLRTVFEAFDRDCPEVFWLTGTYYVSIPEYKHSRLWNEEKGEYEDCFTGDLYMILESPSFNMKQEQYQEEDVLQEKIERINDKVNQILSGAENKTNEEKVKYFNEWLTKHNEYNHRIGTGKETVTQVLKSYPDAFECTAALEGLTGNYGPVCEAYARAMKVLCDQSEIPCVLVDGYAINSVSGYGENHMWNYVEMDGAWYAVDVTWNDPFYGKKEAISGYECEDYMLIGAEDYTKVSGGSMKFKDSHPVTNKLYADSIGLVNGPILSDTKYTAIQVPELKDVSLEAEFTTVVRNYTESPKLTAVVEMTSEPDEEILYKWYHVNEDGEEILLEENSASMVFPENIQPGIHTIRVNVTYGEDTKEAEVQIEVIEISFSDVTEKDYFYQPVIWAVLNKVTAGYYEDFFAPEINCTRGQVVTFLWRAQGCPEPKTTNNPFSDVKDNDYYYKAILWAVENGITAGYYEDFFAPEVTITRAQFATFLYRAEGKPEYHVENPFSDIKEKDYYYDAVLWAVENEITAGYYQDFFAPEIGCTRGQVVSFLYRNR